MAKKASYLGTSLLSISPERLNFLNCVSKEIIQLSRLEFFSAKASNHFEWNGNELKWSQPNSSTFKLIDCCTRWLKVWEWKKSGLPFWSVLEFVQQIIVDLFFSFYTNTGLQWMYIPIKPSLTKPGKLELRTLCPLTKMKASKPS